MKFTAPIIILTGFLLLTCDPKKEKVPVTEGLKKEMNARELKKVTEAEIFNAGLERGKLIAVRSQNALAGSLKSAIQAHGMEGAIKYCNLSALSIVDSLSEKYKAEIRRASMQYRNPADEPDSLEQIILEAYAYNAENSQELKPNLQSIGEKYLLYTHPIVLNNPLCLNCHGKVGEHMTKETYRLIKSLYPEDRATGYKMGDLRGMWSIKLSKKNIINSL